MDLSFQKKKTVLKSVSWFLRYEINKKSSIFLGRPVDKVDPTEYCLIMKIQRHRATDLLY